VRITFVLPFVNLTGGIRVMLDYANWLHHAGHHILVVYPRWPYRFQYTRRQQWTEFQKHRRIDNRVPWFDLRCPLVCVPLIRTAFLPPSDLVVATAWPTVHDVAGLHPSRGKKVHVVMHHESGTGPEGRIRAIYQAPFYRIAFAQSVRESIETRFTCRIHDVVPNASIRRPSFQTDASTSAPSCSCITRIRVKARAMGSTRCRDYEAVCRICSSASVEQCIPIGFLPG
jgi:hypothetical protein